MTTEEQNDTIEPMTFAERYRQEKLIKKAKKKARKELETQGIPKGIATKMVNQSVRNIVNDNKPQKRSTGRGR
jgi:hypothetical protein